MDAIKGVVVKVGLPDCVIVDCWLAGQVVWLVGRWALGALCLVAACTFVCLACWSAGSYWLGERVEKGSPSEGEECRARKRPRLVFFCDQNSTALFAIFVVFCSASCRCKPLIRARTEHMNPAMCTRASTNT
jgi:hypothetical protein